MPTPDLKTKNRRILISVLVVVVVMIGASFAAVPLYNLFCRVTGFGGTTQMSATAPDPSEIVDRTITIHFNTDTGRNLLWKFEADQRAVKVKIGQPALASFTLENQDRVPVAGTALYNVTPAKAGKYFHKTQCFCFAEQIMQPGQETTLPVVFFLSPDMAKDPNLDDVTVITLSYTYFKADTPELDAAWEAFNQADNGPDNEGVVKTGSAPADSLVGTVALEPEKQ
ncbi:cytochrome c oxidase assembly protein [Micavibrio aeruginosavorus]|uniref:cytochrome c oxidase assembly protein n=1 Tax=Micavibrio aeruginosavorus TaxID=349221 RepID=UPI003F4A9A20